MSTRDHIKASISHMADVLDAYTADLSDQDLLVRPTPKANHIAWQLGHLLSTQSFVIGVVFPGRLPVLPDGFADCYTKEASEHDKPSAFHTRNEFAEIAKSQRAAILNLLDEVSEDELMVASPEPFAQTGTIGVALGFVASTHWLWHAGQFTVIRASLSKPRIV